MAAAAAAGPGQHFEDVRMTRLREAMGKTVDGAIGGVSRAEFMECFPDLVHTHEAALGELYTQLTATVRANVMVRPPPPRAPSPSDTSLPWLRPARDIIPLGTVALGAQQEFAKICEETDLVNKLNELDRMSSDSASVEVDLAKTAPADAMRDERMQLKMQERERLKAMIQQTEGECEQVRGRLGAHRAKVSTMEAAVKEAGERLTEVRKHVQLPSSILLGGA